MANPYKWTLGLCSVLLCVHKALFYLFHLDPSSTTWFTPCLHPCHCCKNRNWMKAHWAQACTFHLSLALCPCPLLPCPVLWRDMTAAVPPPRICFQRVGHAGLDAHSQWLAVAFVTFSLSTKHKQRAPPLCLDSLKSWNKTQGKVFLL